MNLTRDLNRPGLTLLRLGRPYVHAKGHVARRQDVRRGPPTADQRGGILRRVQPSCMAGWTRSLSAAHNPADGSPPRLGRRGRVPVRVVLSGSGTLPPIVAC